MDKYTFAVTNEPNLNDPKKAVITTGVTEELPIEKLKIVPKSKNPYYISFYNSISEKYETALMPLPTEEEGHKLLLTFFVDHNSLPYLYQKPYIIPEILSFPKKLTSKSALNIPVIGFYDNSSVIYVLKGLKYTFAENWNGYYGNDLYLSFQDEGYSSLFTTSLNDVSNKDPFMVYDLVKILSMSLDDIKQDPKWRFKVITNDDPEKPILLQLDKPSLTESPEFFIGLILKHHIKAIKKETGNKPNKLGFQLFNDFDVKERERIFKGLEKVCDNFDGIDFVSLEDF